MLSGKASQSATAVGENSLLNLVHSQDSHSLCLPVESQQRPSPGGMSGCLMQGTLHSGDSLLGHGTAH